MTRLVTLLLMFEILYVRTTRVVDSTNLIDTLEKLLDKVDKFELHEAEKDFIDSDNDYEIDDVKSGVDMRLLTADQVLEMNRAIQDSGKEGEDFQGEKIEDPEDDVWPDDDTGELDYAMDGSEDWDTDEDIRTSSHSPVLSLLTPSRWVTKVPVIYADPIAATNERPRILDDSKLSKERRKEFRPQFMEHLKTVLRTGQCSVPQPRWLRVRQLAPAADIVYSPSCVLLHRCAPDSGCCLNENEECAPIEGHYVALPFMLSTVSLNNTFGRMEFYNHTRCGCVTREVVKHRAMLRVERDQAQEGTRTRWHRVDAPVTEFVQTRAEHVVENDEQLTEPPPMLRKCVCPTLFLAKMTDKGCKCVCEWNKNYRRRDCLSLSRGFEHFGLKDRECITQGVCNAPMCDYGPYDSGRGTCPLMKGRWMRPKIRIRQEKPSPDDS